MTIENVTCFEGKRGVRWIAGGRTVERRFQTDVILVPLRSGNGILVVEPAGDGAPDNAFIIGPDGSVMKQIRNPEAGSGAIAFGDAYYVGHELTLFISFPSRQMGCVITETGDVTRLYESR